MIMETQQSNLDYKIILKKIIGYNADILIDLIEKSEFYKNDNLDKLINFINELNKDFNKILPRDKFAYIIKILVEPNPNNYQKTLSYVSILVS